MIASANRIFEELFNVNQIQAMKGTGKKSAALVVGTPRLLISRMSVGLTSLSSVTLLGSNWGH